MVINGPKKFCRINGVAVLTRVFFTRKCMVVFARLPKKSGYNNEVAWLYYQGGRKAGFHCTKFKKLRKVYNLPFFSVLGHFFYPKFPLTSLTKKPSTFLFSASLYLKEIKTKKNVKYFLIFISNNTCITCICILLWQPGSEKTRELKMRQFSGSALH